MFVKLFDVQNDRAVPAECCYVISWLKDIIKEYPSNYIKVYSYLQFMSSRDPQNNPYLLIIEEEREQTILHDIQADFSVEDDMIVEALKKCKELTETPKYKAWRSQKIQIDRLIDWLANTVPFSGKDGNIKDIRETMKEMPALQAAYNKLENEMIEETKGMSRGNKDLGYDVK